MLPGDLPGPEPRRPPRSRKPLRVTWPGGGVTAFDRLPAVLVFVICCLAALIGFLGAALAGWGGAAFGVLCFVGGMACEARWNA